MRVFSFGKAVDVPLGRMLLKPIKILGWVLIAVFAMAVAILCVFIAVNWKDESLRPEVKQAMDWRLPAGAYEDNGYILLLGMTTPESVDPREAGRQVLQAQLKRYAEHDESMPEFKNSLSSVSEWREQACNYLKQPSCVDFYLENKGSVLDSLSKNPVLERRFSAVVDAKNFTEVLPPYLYATFPPWENLVAASEMARVRAINEIANDNEQAGVNRLIENATFSRRLLRQASSLIGRMIAIAIVQRDMRIISELVHKYPELGRRYGRELLAVAAPISGAEFSMKKPLSFEKEFVLDVLKAIPQDQLTGAMATPNPWLDAPLVLVYQPNATANLFGAWYDLNARLATAPADALDSEKVKIEQAKSELLGYGVGLLYIRNPVGKILAVLNGATYTNYVERQHDTDGYIRLVALQIKLAADRVPVAEIGDSVNAAPDEFRDPYTREPMEWNASTGVLRFHGRQPSNFNFGRSNVFSVPVL